MCIDGLKSNGTMLDFINIMSYDTSPVYDPIVAFI
jgi:GH18 family chitinase